jgi:hypothetical protein
VLDSTQNQELALVAQYLIEKDNNIVDKNKNKLIKNYNKMMKNTKININYFYFIMLIFTNCSFAYPEALGANYELERTYYY